MKNLHFAVPKNTMQWLLITLLWIGVSVLPASAQTPKKSTATAAQAATLQVIQFHSEHRCVTCNLIEKLSRETTRKFPNATFVLINVDDAKNEKIAEQFEATGTALFLYQPKTGKKKDLTDFAFLNAKSNAAKFQRELANEINAFK